MNYPTILYGEIPLLVYQEIPPLRIAQLYVHDSTFSARLENGSVKEVQPQLHQYITGHIGVEDTAHSMSFNNEYTIDTRYISVVGFEVFLKGCFKAHGYDLQRAN